MQRGFTNKRPVKIMQGIPNPDPTDVRQVLIFNNSGVSLWLGDDENSATSINGVPVLPGSVQPFLWATDLWVGADVDGTEFRYMVSPHFATAGASGSGSWAELGRATPQPPNYYNKPAGR